MWPDTRPLTPLLGWQRACHLLCFAHAQVGTSLCVAQVSLSFPRAHGALTRLCVSSVLPQDLTIPYRMVHQMLSMDKPGALGPKLHDTTTPLSSLLAKFQAMDVPTGRAATSLQLAPPKPAAEAVGGPSAAVEPGRAEMVATPCCMSPFATAAAREASLATAASERASPVVNPFEVRGLFVCALCVWMAPCASPRPEAAGVPTLEQGACRQTDRARCADSMMRGAIAHLFRQ
jgi:hypothetical protein